MPAFIETQFPIARLSAESFRERKAVSGQTLTGLGKWWGRKPLILVRASILGMLMPASGNPRRDREVFLKILTMDDNGVWQRLKPAARRRVSRADFDAMTYADRIKDCERPENVDGPSAEAWADINSHIGTTATSLSELVEQLGQRAFGHTPRVGDAFCGGGSIPFEAARIGCAAFGSDLNPVAGLLTWASLNLLGGDKAEQEEVRKAQKSVFAEADQQISEWRIEHNERGERAEAFLYCVEVKPDGCGNFIPLAPSWVVDEYTKVIVRWHHVAGSDRLGPKVAVVSSAEIEECKKTGPTVVDSRVVDPFDLKRSWSIEALRGSDGLRRWINDDLVPRKGDVFQERLYCIRWMDSEGNRRYAAPDAADLRREARVLELVRERFVDWQRLGFIPSKGIPEDGAETARLFRERGWTHWHHLFTPRQLLTHGLIASYSMRARSQHLLAAAMLNIGRLSDWNSRLSCWLSSKTQIAGGKNTFLNQALNTLFNYSTRPLLFLDSAQIILSKQFPTKIEGSVTAVDAREIGHHCDIWITDPPYADAVNYHELGDFFLAWYDKALTAAFPGWTADARAELAVRGNGEDFRRSMVDIYKNLARHMPDNGLQMVQFTHQDPAVWADLGMILWAAGLKSTAAWTISTETEAVGIKKGNYVTGTVCLILRKRTAAHAGFLDEIFPLVEDEVKRQIDSMQALDEGGEPNFNDADYQLAAYAAALKVLTQYGAIDGRDVEHEVFAVRERGQKSDFQSVIERALGIACDYLVPRGLDASWRDLTLVERYYLRALDIESRGERRKGMYEELARGFGVADIKPLLKADKANGASMHTPSGLESALLAAPSGAAPVAGTLLARRGRAATSAPHPFASSSLRHLLFAIRETVAANNDPEPGRQYLRDTYGPSVYWQHRERFLALLEWLAGLGNTAGMEAWATDSAAARLLAGRLRNDQA